MTYQEGQIGDVIVYTAPSQPLGVMRLGQIMQGDGTYFYVEVWKQKPFSPMGGGNLWLSVPEGTIERYDPQYCKQ